MSSEGVVFFIRECFAICGETAEGDLAAVLTIEGKLYGFPKPILQEMIGVIDRYVAEKGSSGETDRRQG